MKFQPDDMRLHTAVYMRTGNRKSSGLNTKELGSLLYDYVIAISEQGRAAKHSAASGAFLTLITTIAAF